MTRKYVNTNQRYKNLVFYPIRCFVDITLDLAQLSYDTHE